MDLGILLWGQSMVEVKNLCFGGGCWSMVSSLWSGLRDHHITKDEAQTRTQGSKEKRRVFRRSSIVLDSTCLW